MKLGACICCYNGERYLPEAIDSILRQDRRPDEILLVNDGSTDATQEVMDRYADEPGVGVIHHPKNLGQGEGFNTVIRNTTADVMCFLDADDIWYPEKTRIVEQVMREESKVVVVQHNTDVVAYDQPTGEQYALFLFTGNLYEMWVKGRILAQLMPTSALSIRTEVLRKVAPVPKVRHSADSYLARAVVAHGETYSIFRSLGTYRRHDTNVFHGNEEHDARAYFDEYIVGPLREHYEAMGLQLPTTLSRGRPSLRSRILDLSLRTLLQPLHHIRPKRKSS